jgi:hypothetical protein
MVVPPELYSQLYGMCIYVPFVLGTQSSVDNTQMYGWEMKSYFVLQMFVVKLAHPTIALCYFVSPFPLFAWTRQMQLMPLSSMSWYISDLSITQTPVLK